MKPIKQRLIGQFERTPSHFALGSVAQGKYIVWSSDGTLSLWKTPHSLLQVWAGDTFDYPSIWAENDSGMVAWASRASSVTEIYASWMTGGVWHIRHIGTYDMDEEITGIWVSETDRVFWQRDGEGEDLGYSFLRSVSPKSGDMYQSDCELPGGRITGYVVGAMGNEYLWRNTSPLTITEYVDIDVGELVSYEVIDDLPEFPGYLVHRTAVWDTSFEIPTFDLPILEFSLEMAVEFYDLDTNNFSGIYSTTGTDQPPVDYLGTTFDMHYQGPFNRSGGSFPMDPLDPGSYDEQIDTVTNTLAPGSPSLVLAPWTPRFAVQLDATELNGGTVELRDGGTSDVLSSVGVSDYVNEKFHWVQTKGRVTYVGVYTSGCCS